MRASEIRIGNLFTDVSGVVISVNAINSDNTVKISDFGSNDVHGFYGVGIINPIRLTENWILKFGYSKHENGYYSLESSNNSVRFFENEFPLWRLNGSDFYFKIEFVHQLQNIFFAHNRYELTLNQ